MNTKTITDPDGDQITFIQGHHGRIIVIDGDDCGDVLVSIDPREIRTALDEVAPEDTMDGLAARVRRLGERLVKDIEYDMEGGVTAAAIEKEADDCPGDMLAAFSRTLEEQHALHQLRGVGDDGTHLRQAVELAKVAATDNDVDEFVQRLARGTFPAPRTFTADDITDEMVDRAGRVIAWLRGMDWEGYGHSRSHNLAAGHKVLEAALTEPTRPEGAEELDALVDRSIRGCSDITSPETVRSIADGLAEQGVRVTGAES